MRKYILLLIAAMFLVACGSNEDELKGTIKKQEKEIEELKEELELVEGRAAIYEQEFEDEEEVSSEDEESEESEEEETEDDSQDNIGDIDYDIIDVVDEDLDDTSVIDIEINEDASVDDERYIVLVDLEWDVKNGASSTEDMLDMYSDHLASNLSDNELIHELVLFWTVPYHNEVDSILKRSYENKDDGMYLDDEAKDTGVFD